MQTKSDTMGGTWINLNIVQFKDRSGERRYGKIMREYPAFEGGIRYIIQDETNGRDYRCVRKNGNFVELTV